MPRGIPRPYDLDGHGREQRPRTMSGLRAWIERYLVSDTDDLGTGEPGDTYSDVTEVSGDRVNGSYYEQACMVTFTFPSGSPRPLFLWLAGDDGLTNTFADSPDWTDMETLCGYERCIVNPGLYQAAAADVITGNAGYGYGLVGAIGTGDSLGPGSSSMDGLYSNDPGNGLLTVGIFRRCYDTEAHGAKHDMGLWQPTVAIWPFSNAANYQTYKLSASAFPAYVGG